MEEPNALVWQTTEMFGTGYDLAMGWLLSHAAWVQFAMLAGAYVLAKLVDRYVTPRLTALLMPSTDNTNLLSNARRFVLDAPEPPDCELRGFGESGINFVVEFLVNGIDDGKNKYTSDVLFLVWNALRDNGIEIPYPHRVIEIKGRMPQ